MCLSLGLRARERVILKFVVDVRIVIEVGIEIEIEIEVKIGIEIGMRLRLPLISKSRLWFEIESEWC